MPKHKVDVLEALGIPRIAIEFGVFNAQKIN